MQRCVLLVLILIAGSPAAAQESAKPVPECVVLPSSRQDPAIRNKCKFAIHLELFDVGKQEVVQGELAPNRVMQAPPEAFGAVCPSGFRSSVPLIPVNRPIFAKDLYACIRG